MLISTILQRQKGQISMENFYGNLFFKFAKTLKETGKTKTIKLKTIHEHL